MKSSRANRLFFLSLLLLSFTACSEKPGDSFSPTEVESGFTATADPLADLLAVPEYAKAKEAINEADWPRAERLLQGLLATGEPLPAYANDLGIVLMQGGDLPAAQAAFERATELDSTYERAFFNLGLVHAQLGDTSASEAAYLKASGINPFYYEAWYNLGLLRYKAGEFQNAREAFLQITGSTRSSRFHRAYYHLGLIAANDGQDAEAVKYYDESILLNPAHKQSYTNKAAALLRLGLNEQARDTLGRAQAIDPRDPLVSWNLGLSFLAENDDSKAREAFRKTISLNPEYAPAYTNLAAIEMRANRYDAADEYLKIANSIDPKNAKILWNLGLTAAARNQDEEAIAYFRRMLELEPESMEGYLNLAAALLRTNRLDEAGYSLDQAEAIDPSDFRISWNRGLIYRATDKPNDAASAFLDVLQRNPDYSPALLNLGVMAMAEEDWEAARRYLQKADELSGDDFRPAWNLGLIARRNGEAEVAEAAFQRVITIDPNYQPALFNLGLIAYQAGEYARAQDLFHRAAYSSESAPYPEAHYMLAKTYSEQNEFNAAINEYEVALRLNPDYTEAAFNLALNLDRSGDKKGAILRYKQIANSGNATAESLNNLASYHISEGNDKEAISLLKRAIAKNPSYSTAAYNLGLAHLRQENLTESIAAFESTIEIDATHFAAWKNLGVAHARVGNYAAALPAMRRAFNLAPADANTAVYVVKYLKLLDRPISEVTEVYQIAYEHGARNPLILRHLAGAASEREDFESAVTFYRDYLKLRPTPPYFYNLGLALRRLDRLKEARDAYQQAVNLQPNFEKAWVNLGVILNTLGDSEAARQAFQNALEADPNYTKASDALAALDSDAYNKGLAHLRAERLDEAVLAFESATRDDSGHFAAWKNLGIAHARSENFAAALPAMRRAFDLNPSDADTAVYVVKYLKLLDRPESEVTQVYQAAYEQGARNSMILRHLASEASSRGDNENAVIFYQEYLKISPSSAYFYNLGLALRRLERLEDAREAYQQAVSLQPNFEKAWVNLGYVHAFLGDSNSAREAFNQALAINPTYTNARDALSELEANAIKL